MAIESVGVRAGRQRGGSGGSSGTIVLGPNDSLKGTLRTENGVTVHGAVEGEIVSAGDVLVESTATVMASIEGRNVDIRGEVVGAVTSAQRLSLSGSGTLQGDASAARLVVEDGATLNGSITMSPGRDTSHRTEETSTPERFGEEHTGHAEVNGELVSAGEHEG